ncbi:hypothetical protein PTSG_07632 [Salpingoeca rosetta]|uniref:Biogenesis of lysosome-related organelles complex 1 subunit 7 n=1 Tax=Salpingoeca rosetta (strain ATCC 50818 / BSB-021) TaxID=946362 RepID=F2UHB6_SALR5|nr:uncharacterized protein PTSG_07632 [Salpingoeca rosetta]EGD76515.1 hypothetical protein PTSG_07632 [Salpingoeca rosetta]|eukprot:XP_004991429.1 hypothetical protein PTSG_07632 [Salpingoeca rosetta]
MDDSRGGSGGGGGGDADAAKARFGQGLKDLIEPAITTIDNHVQATQKSQESLRVALDQLHQELTRFRQLEGSAVDIDAYLRKLLEARQNVNKTNGILEQVQVRTNRMMRSVDKVTAGMGKTHERLVAQREKLERLSITGPSMPPPVVGGSQSAQATQDHPAQAAQGAQHEETDAADKEQQQKEEQEEKREEEDDDEEEDAEHDEREESDKAMATDDDEGKQEDKGEEDSADSAEGKTTEPGQEAST